MTRILTLCVLILLGCAVASCDKPADDLTTVRVGQYAFPPGLGNPFKGSNAPSVFFWSALFDGLTYVNGDGEVEPALALSWRNTDERTWVFELRPGVTFSNGETFDAQTVVRNFEFLNRPEAASWILTREAQEIEQVTALDDLTVSFKTVRSWPALPRTMSLIMMVAPDAWGRLGPDEFALSPVGTGPFKLTNEWTGQSLEFEAFTDSWRPPKVERLIMLEIPESTTRVQGIVSGKLDIAIALGPEEIPLVESAGGRMAVRQGTGVLTISFALGEDTPLKDRRVRRALNHAVNKERLVESLLAGATRPSGHGLPAHVEGYDPTLAPYEYDPDKARALLAESGYPDGIDVVFEIALGGSANDVAVFQQIGNDLRQAGINAEIRTIPLQKLARGIFQGGWAGDGFNMDYGATAALDPLRPLRLHSCRWNAPWYCNEEAMPLIEAAGAEFDSARRIALIRQIYRIYRDDAAALYLYDTVGFDAVGPRIATFVAPNGVLDYSNIEKSN